MKMLYSSVLCLITTTTIMKRLNWGKEFSLGGLGSLHPAPSYQKPRPGPAPDVSFLSKHREAAGDGLSERVPDTYMGNLNYVPALSFGPANPQSSPGNCRHLTEVGGDS